MGSLGGGSTPNSVKIFASEICTDIKNTGIVNLVQQKLDFWVPPWGVRGGGGWHPHTTAKYLSVVSVDIKK